MDVIEEFYNLALEFCRYIETTTITYDNVEELMPILMNLYVKALLGVTVVELLSLIPFIGALVSIMSVLFGLGFILTSSTKKK